MKHLLTIFTLSFIFVSCGEESAKTEGTEVATEVQQKNTGDEATDLMLVQELDEQLVKNDLTIDLNVAKELYTRSLAFSKEYPKSADLELVLSYAAKGAEGIENYTEAVEILHRLANDLPESNKTVIYMYNKGKILEEKLKNKEAAKLAYKELIERFPKNPISRNMKAYLNNGLIDMSKEEKIKYLQEQNQELE